MLWAAIAAHTVCLESLSAERIRGGTAETIAAPDPGFGGQRCAKPVCWGLSCPAANDRWLAMSCIFEHLLQLGS